MVAISLLIVLIVAAVLTIDGHLERLAPFLSAVGPYLLPITFAAGGYAFGRHEQVRRR